MNQTGRTISDYYNGKSILITGATGFIGKVLIWKLLQSCSSLDTIYILVRPKRGKNKDSRVTELLQVPIFERFKKENPQILCKIKAVVGDISQDNLGLSAGDEEKLVDTVHIIFHIAAVVKFNADLKDAINLNVEGTQRLLKLATKMRKLEVFVHTSTAYCHCDVPELEEKTYKTRESPQQVIDLVNWMKPDLLKSISYQLIKPHPNTYTYSKRLAESLVADYYPKLPVVIVRPTLVMPALYEPIPGWVDNTNGLVGLMPAMNKGVLRAIWCNKDTHADLIAVDVLSSDLIAIVWKTEKDKRRISQVTQLKDVPVYNLGAVGEGIISPAEIADTAIKVQQQYPFSSTLWYPTITVCSNFYVYIALTVILQWIPACLIDALMFVFGYKTIMIRIQRKIYNGIKVYRKLSTYKWNFVKNNISQVGKELSDGDKDIFRLANDKVDKLKYTFNMAKVVRWYLMKEDPSNLPTARRRMKVLYFLHCVVKIAFWVMVLRMILY